MRTRRETILRSILAVAVAALLSSAVAIALPASLEQSFDVQVPWRPLPVTIAGKKRLLYELHLTNFAAKDLVLKRIEVMDSAGAVLADFKDSDLRGIIGRIDRAGATDKLRIPPGVRVLAYLSVELGKPGAKAARLTHRIEYQVAEASDPAFVQGGTFSVSDEPPILIGPPLRGGPWVAIYDASWERGHRRVAYATAGSVHIPGRFAIDWIKVDSNGKYFNNDGSKIADWYGYGAEVLAVSDAVVAAIRDNVAESATLLKTPGPVKLEDAAGNYVALDLGAGHYAFYEHLKPGSIRVKLNEHVRRGSVVGLLGYTGESTGPHLHFHIADGNAPLNAEGLPYQLQGLKTLGAYPSIETFGKSQAWSPVPSKPDAQPPEFPAPLSVLQFPD